ncbi:MAG: hypothetical protein QOJ99_3490 [Bryobacterales bacterium]|jgi:hypothetical protein|nr:hypothetical protein [Bryobacterales bacterium]
MPKGLFCGENNPPRQRSTTSLRCRLSQIVHLRNDRPSSGDWGKCDLTDGSFQPDSSVATNMLKIWTVCHFARNAGI